MTTIIVTISSVYFFLVSNKILIIIQVIINTVSYRKMLSRF